MGLSKSTNRGRSKWMVKNGRSKMDGIFVLRAVHFENLWTLRQIVKAPELPPKGTPLSERPFTFDEPWIFSSFWPSTLPLLWTVPFYSEETFGSTEPLTLVILFLIFWNSVTLCSTIPSNSFWWFVPPIIESTAFLIDSLVSSISSRILSVQNFRAFIKDVRNKTSQS